MYPEENGQLGKYYKAFSMLLKDPTSFSVISRKPGYHFHVKFLHLHSPQLSPLLQILQLFICGILPSYTLMSWATVPPPEPGLLAWADDTWSCRWNHGALL